MSMVDRRVWCINIWTQKLSEATSQCAADRNGTQKSMYDILYLDRALSFYLFSPHKNLPKGILYIWHIWITSENCMLSSDIKEQLWRSIRMMKTPNLCNKKSPAKSRQVAWAWWMDMYVFFLDTRTRTRTHKHTHTHRHTHIYIYNDTICWRECPNSLLVQKKILPPCLRLAAGRDPSGNHTLDGCRIGLGGSCEYPWHGVPPTIWTFGQLVDLRLVQLGGFRLRKLGAFLWRGGWG